LKHENFGNFNLGQSDLSWIIFTVQSVSLCQPPTSSPYWPNINNRRNSHFINISSTLQLDNFSSNMEINMEINGTTFCAAHRDSL